MAMKKDNKCHRVNFVVTEAIQEQVTQVCDETGLNESEFWRAAGNKLLEFLQSHGFSAIHQYRKDAVYEPKIPAKKNIVPFNRGWSRMESGMVLGCNEASYRAMLIICQVVGHGAYYLCQKASQYSRSAVSRPGATSKTSKGAGIRPKDFQR